MSEDALDGKTLLILGGTPQQLKLVEAARSLGVRTVVVDWLETSPVKRAADAAYVLDIKDVDGIVEMARREHVDGVACGWIDPAQRPYQKVCERLGVPCYGTREQFHLMTDKNAFKEMCHENGVGVIPSWTAERALAGEAEFPLFVKPVDSRGSRGQAVCRDVSEADEAIEAARRESSDNGVVIEKYMGGCQEFQVTYFFVGGRPYLVRTADSFTGSPQSGLDKVVLGAVSPSRYTELYLREAHEGVVRMFERIGFHDGPIFMQGFVDGNAFRFFDPGLRFPGVDYERVYRCVFGIDLAEALVRFALTGNLEGVALPEDGVWLDGKVAAVLFPTLKPGIVGDVSCLDEVADMDEVVVCIPRVERGERIGLTCDVNQRLAEIDVLANGYEDLERRIFAVQERLSVRDSEGNDMIFETFDSGYLSRLGYGGPAVERRCAR